MTSGQRTTVEEASRHEGELNQRQRHVLDLIVQGRTNPEIAADLGITLDGAKWHVSEILTKLGFSSREEAADYWRERNRPGTRLRRAKLGVESREEAVRAWRAEKRIGPRFARSVQALLSTMAIHKVAVAAAAGTAVAVAAGGIVISALWSGSTSTDESRLAANYQCPITIPGEPFFATEPYPRQPPDAYHAVWYGNDDLWTMVQPEGEVWRALPEQGGSFSQKTFWWSRNFGLAAGEGPPAIGVTGKRLDAPGSFAAGNPGTNATADFGRAMLVGIDIPAAGCWEIRARYEGAELAYVVLVE